MAEVRFSRRAEADLVGIGSYTLRTWGEDQALRLSGHSGGLLRIACLESRFGPVPAATSVAVFAGWNVAVT